ncbi:ABC transporter ATP-binding protein [Roseomonas sp. E05]|uniref:ABC transporter ATP-binding protein n=1 Tax=Roseomonas sp. E05 TaxID=3046310 RepID=UPI0024B8976F|nr:ABC transporter ATP-binding protein [Roseomonas sp. E05]MDJ0388788.1 ABC transporter ATP-binding protein [Roseomonas sp. E05]
MTELLAVRDLAVAYANGTVHAVDGANLTLRRGGMLGLVGESGCGKTTLARALMGVLPGGARITRGEARLDGTDLVALAPAERRARLWRDLAFVPQTAMSALDPVYRLRDQMREVLCDRGGLSRAEADMRAAELFEAVGLHPRRLADYPHQFSGGMRQRAAIALALALRPKLVIADEPVTALDVIVQRQVLDTFRSLSAELGLSAIIVTHDISVVAYLCDQVAVMYAGRVVEHGPTDAVLEQPSHPYTMGLMNAFPDLESDEAVLAPIEGSPPPLSDPPPGCRFAPRCPFAEAICTREVPPPVTLAPDHWSACHRAPEAAALRQRARDPLTWRDVAEAAA